MFRASISPSSGVFTAVATCCHLVHVVLGVCPRASGSVDVPEVHCKHGLRPLYGCGAEVWSVHATATLTLVMIGDPGEILWKHGILNYYRPMTPGFFLSADAKDGELRASTKVLLNNHSHDRHNVKKKKEKKKKKETGLQSYVRSRMLVRRCVARFHFRCCGVPPQHCKMKARRTFETLASLKPASRRIVSEHQRCLSHLYHLKSVVSGLCREVDENCTLLGHYATSGIINTLNPELNPICYLLALLGAHHFLHVSRTRVKLLTFRLLMSYIYIYIYIYI